MKNVVAYCLASADTCVDVQKQKIMEYCSQNNMQISQWYVDEQEDRPQFDVILYGEVQNPPVEAVIVYRSDLVAGDIKLYFYYMMLLEKKGIELLSATEPVVDDGTGLGNVYHALMLFVAEQERKNIARRTGGGRAVKSAKGGYSGGRPPYGYRPVGGSLTVVTEEAEVVRKIFEMKKGGATYQQICDALNAEGKTNRSGTRFSISTVQTILKNENVYRGLYKYGKAGQWVKGQQKAIL